MKKTKMLFAFLSLAIITTIFAGCGNDSTPAGFSITTASLPGATVGTAYSQTLAASGGTGALTWSVTTGTLPAGLSLTPATGVISGTPTTAGAVNFTVSVTDSATPTANTATKALLITVTAPGALAITTTTLPGATVGAAYSQTLAATGGTGTLTWTITSGSLAPLTLSNTGTITGTPTAAGTLNFTVTVTDSAATPVTVSKVLSIIVAAAGVDTAPDTFSFTAQTGVALSTVITSNSITVAGINSPSPISITGGTYSINGGTFTSTAGTVTNGQTVAVQHTSSAANTTVTTTTLNIGGVSALFTSTTLAAVVDAAALYQAQCSGCHSLGTVDPTGSPNLSGKTTVPSRFTAGVATSHNGVSRTLSAAEIAALSAYVLAN